MSPAADAGADALVSVIIPTRDRADLLERAVESATLQSYPRLEVIVVDDGSVDETPEVLRRLTTAGPRVRSLRHAEPRGAAAARNTGAAAAEGGFLLFEDDDCRGRPDRVEKLVAALATAPRAVYAYSWIRRSGSAAGSIVHGRGGPWTIGPPCALIRRSAFEAVGHFDEAMPRLQDLDLWARLLARGEAVEVPEVLVETVRDGSGISASKERLEVASSRLLRKYQRTALPRSHLARMHRLIGGALMMSGCRSEALKHFRRSLRADPLQPRSWTALLLGLLGARAYRTAVRTADLRGSD